MSVSVFRRYTPPTCTLELQGTRSPLSVWSDRAMVKDIQFNLRIDGPHRHSQQKVAIQGDRLQLDDLYQAVSTYVQQTLTLSVEQFQASFLQASAPAPTVLPSHRSATPQTVASPSSLPRSMAALPNPAQGTTLHLAPLGLLQHQLHLGPFARNNTPDVIVLTTTELFDLANALDTYHGEIDSIPELNPGKYRRTPAPWLKVAAAAVLAIGVGTSVVRLSQSPGSAGNLLQSQADAPASVAERSDSDRLPTRVQLSDIPSATEALPAPRGGDRRNNRANAGQGNNRQAEQRNQNREGSNQNNSNRDEEAIAFNNLDNDALRNNPRASTDRRAADAPTAGSTPSSPAPSALSPAPLGGSGQASPNANAQRANPPANQPRVPAEIPPELSALPPISAMGDDILLDSSEMNLSAPPGSSASGSTAERNTRSIPTPNDEAFSSSASGWAAGSSTYPQLAEVRSYFADQWTPPPNLSQPLQYRLLLNPDGSLRQVVPLGESARSSTSVVGFPAVGEPFVSSFDGNSAPPIRLFLDADGQVRVFLESLD